MKVKEIKKYLEKKNEIKNLHISLYNEYKTYLKQDILKLLDEKFNNDMISNTEYVHYEMIINEILGTNIHRNLNKRNTIS